MTNKYESWPTSQTPVVHLSSSLAEGKKKRTVTNETTDGCDRWVRPDLWGSHRSGEDGLHRPSPGSLGGLSSAPGHWESRAREKPAAGPRSAPVGAWWG